MFGFTGTTKLDGHQVIFNLKYINKTAFMKFYDVRWEIEE